MDGARFLVRHTLTLTSIDTFFLTGDVVRGDVRAGMMAAADAAGFHEPIHAVEVADYRAERRAEVALGFRYRDAAELTRWQSIPWEGVELKIPAEPILHPCPCCGFRTMREEWRGSYDLCPVCDWEDDGVQYDDPDYRGGANEMSLNQARERFAARHDASSS